MAIYLNHYKMARDRYRELSEEKYEKENMQEIDIICLKRIGKIQ